MARGHGSPIRRKDREPQAGLEAPGTSPYGAQEPQQLAVEDSRRVGGDSFESTQVSVIICSHSYVMVGQYGIQDNGQWLNKE